MDRSSKRSRSKFGLRRVRFGHRSDGGLTARSPKLWRDPEGHETILLVEDETGLRRLCKRVLECKGHQVLEAATGREGVGVWAQHQERIDLLFTDLVMPDGMTGLELAERVWAEGPLLKVVQFSGYSAELIKPEVSIRYLPKPHSLTSVVEVVRDCLDGRM